MELDGHPLPSLDPSWLRGEVLGVISQEPVLFATSVKENIRYGRPSATDEEVGRELFIYGFQRMLTVELLVASYYSQPVQNQQCCIYTISISEEEYKCLVLVVFLILLVLW